MKKPWLCPLAWLGLFAFCGILPAEWQLSPTPMRANLRGLSAVNRNVAWASGTNGTVVRTVDAGTHWFPRPVPSIESLDFRDIEARSADLAYLMSAGPGGQSRIYKTEDGGNTWTLLLQNQHPGGFFDAIAFWDDLRGLHIGDPIDGRFFIRRTEDGGETWAATDPANMPQARAGEAAFAASGTCLIVAPNGLAWFVTGGTGGGRVFHSRDGGRSWTVDETAVPHKTESSGLFSIAATPSTWIAVGGDYRLETSAEGNLAVRNKSPRTPPSIFLSAVLFQTAKNVLAAGPRGTFQSSDAGDTWQSVSDEGFHTLSIASDGTIYAAGARGRIARWVQ